MNINKSAAFMNQNGTPQNIQANNFVQLRKSVSKREQSEEKYMGELKEGLKNGYGLWLEDQDDPNSNQYRGDFLNDKKWGYGVFKWSSGNYYKGNYRNDERDGYGEMYWKDGSVYKGHWHNGIQHGFGTMIFPDGTFIKGYFKNNVFLNANKIPEKAQKISYNKPTLETQPYNLPVIKSNRYKSSMEINQMKVLDEVRRSFNPSQNNSLQMTKKSIDEHYNKNNTFYTAPIEPSMSKVLIIEENCISI